MLLKSNIILLLKTLMTATNSPKDNVKQPENTYFSKAISYAKSTVGLDTSNIFKEYKSDIILESYFKKYYSNYNNLASAYNYAIYQSESPTLEKFDYLYTNLHLIIPHLEHENSKNTFLNFNYVSDFFTKYLDRLAIDIESSNNNDYQTQMLRVLISIYKTTYHSLIQKKIFMKNSGLLPFSENFQDLLKGLCFLNNKFKDALNEIIIELNFIYFETQMIFKTISSIYQPDDPEIYKTPQFSSLYHFVTKVRKLRDNFEHKMLILDEPARKLQLSFCVYFTIGRFNTLISMLYMLSNMNYSKDKESGFLTINNIFFSQFPTSMVHISMYSIDSREFYSKKSLIYNNISKIRAYTNVCWNILTGEKALILEEDFDLKKSLNIENWNKSIIKPIFHKYLKSYIRKLMDDFVNPLSSKSYKAYLVAENLLNYALNDSGKPMVLKDYIETILFEKIQKGEHGCIKSVDLLIKLAIDELFNEKVKTPYVQKLKSIKNVETLLKQLTDNTNTESLPDLFNRDFINYISLSLKSCHFKGSSIKFYCLWGLWLLGIISLLIIFFTFLYKIVKLAI